MAGRRRARTRSTPPAMAARPSEPATMPAVVETPVSASAAPPEPASGDTAVTNELDWMMVFVPLLRSHTAVTRPLGPTVT